MKWSNELTAIVGVKYPVIQAPMFGVGTPQMVEAAAKSGVLGSLPLSDLSKEESLLLINQRQRLAKLFLNS
ncbi:hypothetical protein [Sphingobacterium sp. LRF_L2]|uniref:hypothetical protein n=1 Tax=Sphingobacterium sp. LRF_L2 TaxID=3369421 RepID=UPI003F616F64